MSPGDDDGVQRHAPASRPADRHFGAGAVLGAAVGGLVVGVLVSVATGPLRGGSDGLSAEGDLRTACQYLEEVGEVRREDVNLEDPMLWRLTAAVDLALAAHKGGAGDDGLAAAVTDVDMAIRELDVDGLNASLAELWTSCE